MEHDRIRSVRWAVAALCCGWVSIGLVACSTAPKAVAAGPGTEQITAVGDWNDVNAAVLVAMERSETVILSQSATELEQTFELLVVTDEHGKLIAHRDAADVNATNPITIRLTCDFEIGGDRDRSRRILEETRRRLADLAGVDYLPVR